MIHLVEETGTYDVGPSQGDPNPIPTGLTGDVDSSHDSRSPVLVPMFSGNPSSLPNEGLKLKVRKTPLLSACPFANHPEIAISRGLADAERSAGTPTGGTDQYLLRPADPPVSAEGNVR
jgi:hypothetical protein